MAVLEYPSWLYHKERKPQLVTSPSLGARMLAAGWSDTPATFQTPEQKEADLDPLGLGSDESLAKADAAKLEAEAEAERAAQLHGTSAAVIIESLETVDDLEQLERIRAREQSNPAHEGGRKGVLAALDKRLNAIIGEQVAKAGG
jgi:hypothetical protein